MIVEGAFFVDRASCDEFGNWTAYGITDHLTVPDMPADLMNSLLFLRLFYVADELIERIPFSLEWRSPACRTVSILQDFFPNVVPMRSEGAGSATVYLAIKKLPVDVAGLYQMATICRGVDLHITSVDVFKQAADFWG